MSRRITPGAPRFDRSGIPIALLMAAVIAVAAGCRETTPAPGPLVVPSATPPPPGRPELAGGGH